MGMGRKPRARLSGDRFGGGCEACRDRRCVSLRQGRAADHGNGSALCHGASRVVRKGWSDAATTQFWRGRREPDRWRILLDGWELYEVWSVGGDLWEPDSGRYSGGFE